MILLLNGDFLVEDLQTRARAIVQVASAISSVASEKTAVREIKA